MGKEYIFATLVIWFFCTMLLLCTIVGILLLIPSENGQRSTWMSIGMKLTEKLIR
jgi:hypothetical protein